MIPASDPLPDTDGFLDSCGETGLLIRRRDWSASPVGPIATWPQSLKTAVGILLRSPVPIVLLWGPEGVMLYNDAYSQFAGARHPQLLGSKVREGWPEVAGFNDHVMKVGLAGGTLAYRDQELTLYRNGAPEQVWMNLDYSPVPDESGKPAGVMAIVVETTARVLAERGSVAERERLRQMFDQAPGFMAMLRGPDHIFELTNAAYLQLIGHRDVVGIPVREALPEIAGQGYLELLDSVYATGRPFVGRGMSVRLQRTPDGAIEQRFVDFVYQPSTDDQGDVIGIFLEGYDVTDTHLAQEALRESEERARRIIEGVKDHGVFTTDAVGTVTDWTPGAQAVFGWPAAEIVGRNADILFTPEDRAAGVPEQELATVREKGCAEDVRWHVRRDGSRFFANGSVRPLHDAQGRLAGTIKIARDETERRATEARLQESEQRYRTLFEAIDAGFCIIEMKFDEAGRAIDYRFLETNPAFERQSGLCGVAGKWMSEVVPDLEPHWFEAYGRVAQTGEAVRFESHAGSVDRWFEVHAFRTGAAEDKRVAVLFNDIDDRKHAEERLRELNATLEERVAERTAERNLLATLVEATDVLVMACDLDYNILALNPANANEFERIYGIRPKAGDNILDLLAPWPEHQEQVRNGWSRGMRGELVNFVEDFGGRDRVRPYYEVTFRPLKDEAGTQIGAYQFATDVTERLRREAQLAEAQEALRQSQKMEAMGQLTGGVAHDFNNLLTPIIGSLDMLQRRQVGGEREQRLIGGALQSADRAKTLVQRLLAFARRQPLQSTAIDIARLLDGMADLVASTSGPQVNVVVRAPADVKPACGDLNQLEMAVLNLAVNARDAMPEGGTLTLSAENGRIGHGHPTKLPPGDYVCLSVADTGSGMDEATLRRAVEPFFSTKGVGKGTGLGLSMVHGLASQLGGALTLSSKPGLGTRIDLWLPVSAAAPGALEADGPAGTASLESGRVLLVDDEAVVRTSTADMLADLGYEVTEAASAQEALSLLDGGLQADLLLTDHLMPGMSGTELAREVRSRWPGRPVLLISGFAEAEGVAPDLPRLTKPFRQQELAAALAGLGR